MDLARDNVTKPKSKIRLLILLANLAGGGAERTAVRLLENLDRDIFEPKIGLLWGTGPFRERVADGDLLLADLPPLESTSYAALALKVPFVHLKMLKEFKPHVVMSLTASMNIATSLALALYSRDKTGWVLREGNNTYRMIQDDLPNRWLAHLRKVVTGFAYRRADAILAISHGLAQGLEENFSIDRSRLHVIHNPVETSPLERRPAQEPRLLAIGRLEYQKGFDLLLEAFAQLSNTSTRLTILGEGSQRQALEGQIAELGLQSRVDLPGFVSDLKPHLQKAHLFVLPSRWEGFGCVVIEAMAQGLPVVVTDCHYGPSEIVSDGVNGLVVKSESVAALAQGVTRVLEDPQWADQLGREAIRRADDFAVERIVKEYEALWSRVVKR